jgi:alcohol oxidase
LHISTSDPQVIGEQFLAAATKKYGIEQVADGQNFATAGKSTRFLKWVNPITGRRSDAAHGFVHPVRDTQDNLHLLLESKAVRVIFEGTKAVGVEYRRYFKCNTTENSNVTGHTGEVRAKLVVLSSGAIATPLILERSGVGEAKRLESLGVDAVSDLPGVGYEYQDHPRIGAGVAKLKGLSPEDSADALFQGDVDVSTKAAEQFKSGKGLLTRNFMDAVIKHGPSAEEVKTMGPDFEKAWLQFVDKPDKPLVANSFFAG